MSPTIEQISALDSISRPEKHLLSSNYVAKKRSGWCHFFRWIAFLITFGQATLNKKLDSQVVKIVQISKEILQSESISSAQKLKIVAALNKLITMSKNNFGKKHHLIRTFIQQHPVNAREPHTPSNFAVQQLTLSEEIVRARQVDTPAQANTWKRGIGRDEQEQSLAAFLADPITQANTQRQRLVIPIVGRMSAKEKRVVSIVADYLQAFHGVQTTVAKEPKKLQIEHKRKCGHQQYAVEPQLEMLSREQDKNSFSLGFTNQDLFPASHGDSMNFIMGIGKAKNGCGLFSTYQLGRDQKVMLKRLMKLASHEFGHMRGIAHCTENSCTMQGVNSVPEMDAVPLIFCAQDMAKICHLNNWSLKEGYQRQLQFFENFSARYGISMDFNREIGQLKRRISKIYSS